MFLLVKKHHTENTFEKFCYLEVAQPPCIFQVGPDILNSLILKTTCARDLIQMSKDAE